MVCWVTFSSLCREISSYLEFTSRILTKISNSLIELPGITFPEFFLSLIPVLCMKEKIKHLYLRNNFIAVHLVQILLMEVKRVFRPGVKDVKCSITINLALCFHSINCGKSHLVVSLININL